MLLCQDGHSAQVMVKIPVVWSKAVVPIRVPDDERVAPVATDTICGGRIKVDFVPS